MNEVACNISEEVYIVIMESNKHNVMMFICSYEFLILSEQMRQNDRVIRKTQRDLERERHDLERQEKKLVRNHSLSVVILHIFSGQVPG